MFSLYLEEYFSMTPLGPPLPKQLFFILFPGMLLFIFTSTTRAQVANQLKWLYFTSDTISADNGELMDIKVRIDNRLSKSIHANIKVTPDEELELVSKDISGVDVPPKEDFFVSFRVLVPQKTTAQNGLRLLFELSDSSGQLLERRYLYVNINTTKNINMFIIQPNVVIRERNQKMSIPVRIYNRGNTAEELTVVTNFPFFPDAGVVLSNQYRINAFADTILNLETMVSRQMLLVNQFSVNISAIYENGDIAGLGSVLVQSLSSSKSFTESGPQTHHYDAPFNHSLELGVQYLFTPYESYIARGGSDLLINKTRIIYNFDAQFWKDNYSDPYLRNTYLQIKQNNNGIIVGNLNRAFDINLTGRGVAAYVRDTSHGTSYELGAMDENYNLLGKSNYSSIENNKSAWSSFGIKKTGWALSSVLIYQENKLDNSDYTVSSNEFKLTRKKFNASAIADISYTKTYLPNASKFAGAGGVSFNGQWGNLSINSENFVSSPYYPGMKRGTRNFSERISFSGKKVTWWGSYSNYYYNPQYLGNIGASQNTFITDKAELGISTNFTPDFSVSVSPIYYHETNSYDNAVSLLHADIMSLGGAVQLNYFNNKKRQYVYMNSEAGFYKAPLTGHDEYHPHFKTSATFKYNFFSLNIYAQLGAFYAGDILSEYYQNNGTTRVINISPMVEAGFLNRRLILLGGATYTENNFSGNGWQATGRADYIFARNYKMYVSFINYRYDYNNYSFTDGRIGLIRDLPVAKITTNERTLTVFLYKDINNNGEYDNADSVASGFQALVDNNIFISGADGKIFYKGLPNGTYSVSAPSVNRWYAPEQNIRFNGKTTVAIGLHRTSTLAGNIVYAKQDAIVYDVEKKKNNISVYATSADGRIFNTKTTDEGQFVLYLPPGDYDIEVREEDRPEMIECNNCRQFVSIKTENLHLIEFVFSVKERGVKLQKFISPSLQKP